MSINSKPNGFGGETGEGTGAPNETPDGRLDGDALSKTDASPQMIMGEVTFDVDPIFNPGSILLGKNGSKISSGGHVLNYRSADGEDHFFPMAHYSDSGVGGTTTYSMGELVNFVSASVADTQLDDGATMLFSSVVTSYSHGVYIIPAETGELTITSHIGTSSSGGVIAKNIIDITPAMVGVVVPVAYGSKYMDLEGSEIFLVFSGVALMGGIQTSGSFNGQLVPYLASDFQIVTKRAVVTADDATGDVDIEGILTGDGSGLTGVVGVAVPAQYAIGGVTSGSDGDTGSYGWDNLGKYPDPVGSNEFGLGLINGVFALRVVLDLGSSQDIDGMLYKNYITTFGTEGDRGLRAVKIYSTNTLPASGYNASIGDLTLQFNGELQEETLAPGLSELKLIPFTGSDSVRYIVLDNPVGNSWGSNFKGLRSMLAQATSPEAYGSPPKPDYVTQAYTPDDIKDIARASGGAPASVITSGSHTASQGVDYYVDCTGGVTTLTIPAGVINFTITDLEATFTDVNYVDIVLGADTLRLGLSQQSKKFSIIKSGTTFRIYSADGGVIASGSI